MVTVWYLMHKRSMVECYDGVSNHFSMIHSIWDVFARLKIINLFVKMSSSKEFFKIFWSLEAALITDPSNSNYSLDVQTSVRAFSHLDRQAFSHLARQAHIREEFSHGSPREFQLSHLRPSYAIDLVYLSLYSAIDFWEDRMSLRLGNYSHSNLLNVYHILMYSFVVHCWLFSFGF